MTTSTFEASATISHPVLHDQSQFEYLQQEGLRNAALYGEAISVLRVRGGANRHNTVALLRARIRDTDVIAHMRDGSFSILLPDTDFLEATLVAEKLRARAEMSIGVACSGGGMHDMVQRSEAAMKKAERLGGNRVCF